MTNELGPYDEFITAVSPGGWCSTLTQHALCLGLHGMPALVVHVVLVVIVPMPQV